MATILLSGVDLYFRGKLEASLPGYRFVTTDSVDEPDLVVADISRVEPNEVADTYPDVPLLGFTNYKDTSGLRAAYTAGFDQVVVKSALVERTEELVRGLLASVE
jgi:DNA-binding NarL/FixJ family response regulator